MLQNILHKLENLAGRCDNGVEVDSTAGGARVGDRGRSSNGLAIDGDHDISGAAIEGHLNKLHSCSDGEILASATNPDRDGSRNAGGRNDEDAVTGAVLGAALSTRVVASGATVGADGLGGGTIPDNGTLSGDGDIASPSLVRSDVVRKDESPGVVGHVVDVNLSTSNNTLGPDRAHVVGFTVVVP